MGPRARGEAFAAAETLLRRGVPSRAPPPPPPKTLFRLLVFKLARTNAPPLPPSLAMRIMRTVPMPASKAAMMRCRAAERTCAYFTADSWRIHSRVAPMSGR